MSPLSMWNFQKFQYFRILLISLRIFSPTSNSKAFIRLEASNNSSEHLCTFLQLHKHNMLPLLGMLPLLLLTHSSIPQSLCLLLKFSTHISLMINSLKNWSGQTRFNPFSLHFYSTCHSFFILIRVVNSTLLQIPHI